MEERNLDKLGFGEDGKVVPGANTGAAGGKKEYIPGLDVAERKFRERKTLASWFLAPRDADTPK
jgi:hypothetical protein